MFQDLGFWGLGFRVRFVPVLKEFRVMLRTVFRVLFKGFLRGTARLFQKVSGFRVQGAYFRV